jgi:hypothetical protein
MKYLIICAVTRNYFWNFNCKEVLFSKASVPYATTNDLKTYNQLNAAWLNS